MNRRGIALTLALAVLVFVGILVSNVDRWLDDQPAFNTGANLIQWMSGPGTFFAAVAFLWTRRK